MNRRIRESVERLREKFKVAPERAGAVFEAATRLISGVTCQAEIREFPPLIVDEPSALGGEDAGPNPVELVLAALGTCQEIMYAVMAAVADVPLDRVEVVVKGYLDLRGLLAMDHDANPGFTLVRYETRIDSPAAESEIRRLVRMVEDHCPVMDTLTRPVPVRGKVRHNGVRIDV